MAPATGEEPMKKARFTDEQIVAILREADNTPVAGVAKKAQDQRADGLHATQIVRG